MEDLNKFKQDVISQFTEELTDKVFLMIQNDKGLMKRYLDQVAAGTSLGYVNSVIAKEVKSRFNLENIKVRNKDPKSTLIQSHEIFKTE